MLVHFPWTFPPDGRIPRGQGWEATFVSRPRPRVNRFRCGQLWRGFLPCLLQAISQLSIDAF